MKVVGSHGIVYILHSSGIVKPTSWTPKTTALGMHQKFHSQMLDSLHGIMDTYKFTTKITQMYINWPYKYRIRDCLLVENT